MSKAAKKPSVNELQKQLEELTQALQRERADAVNLRRRTEEERARLADFYKAMVIKDLLPAIDNLERALGHTPKDLKNHDYTKGIQAVFKQFERAFSELGVKRIKTVGEEFDPKYHEAVSMEDPSTSLGQSGELVEVVCEELQPGYKIGDEVIRHAMVKVKRQNKEE
jgi:molecular chaperone GrpE